MKRTTLKKVYMIVITALLLVAVAVSVAYLCFAWFAENKAVTASGMLTSVNADKGMEFTDTVTAIHYTVSGDVITYTYKKDSTGNLTLTTKETVNSDKTEKTIVDLTATTPTITLYTSTDSGTTWSDGTPYEYSYNETDGIYTYTVTNEDKTTETVTVYEEYLINNILPEEYIDVTIGFYLTGSSLSLKDKGYTVTLGDFAKESKNVFDLKVNTTTTESSTSTSSSTITCGVLPAFKWRTVTEVGEADTSNKTYTFFHGEYDSSKNSDGGFFYYVNGGDDSTYTETIEDDGEWTENNIKGAENFEAVSFTFRIMEDFTEYYKLFDYTVSGGTAEYDNYLSNKIMNIGQIRLAAKEDSST